ncbi:MAG: hypothetical protein HFJ54_00555 [Clostridia bacterium]|nr:hypothetical protein [Clostridia bacterium]
MSSCELVNLVSMLSCLIVENYTDEEISVLAAVFTQLGDSLATILANNTLLDSKSKSEDDSPP